MVQPDDMLIVIPSRLGVGEAFSIKVKVRGDIWEVPVANAWCTPKPRPQGPFNRNIQRDIRYMEDCLPEWNGELAVEAAALEGPNKLVFDGKDQGVFPDDRRPIKTFHGFRFTEPGIHFIKLTDRASGLAVWSNPVEITAAPPVERIWWGDPHIHTYFSDAIRCPEELYTFARDEAFLNFAVITDHMEALTDRMWDYFQGVTDDFNIPGQFATLQGQEWTNHRPERGAPGHRNLYFRGKSGPPMRCFADDCDTLPKLWARLDEITDLQVISIPHHCSNKMMGIDWDQGWNPKYDKAIEIYSIWVHRRSTPTRATPGPLNIVRVRFEADM